MKEILSVVLMLMMIFTCFASDETVPKGVILVVSFGTSFNDNRDPTIGAIEADVQAAFPEWEVRRAFTAQTVIDILVERDSIEADNMTEAMERLVVDGVKRVIIAPPM